MSLYTGRTPALVELPEDAALEFCKYIHFPI